MLTLWEPLPRVETEAIISNKCLVTKGTDGAIEVILYDSTLHQNTLGQQILHQKCQQIVHLCKVSSNYMMKWWSSFNV
jgi:hypothetical protein